jgi:hypothetical protein
MKLLRGVSTQAKVETSSGHGPYLTQTVSAIAGEEPRSECLQIPTCSRSLQQLIALAAIIGAKRIEARETRRPRRSFMWGYKPSPVLLPAATELALSQATANGRGA